MMLFMKEYLAVATRRVLAGNNRFYLFLIFIFILSFLLRFYKLGQIPFGFSQDESAIGYNAYSILQTGKDEYGKFLPVYFKSFGDYKLPVYFYLTALSVKIFNLNEFSVRFSSALLGSVSVVILYFLVKDISGNKKMAGLSSFLLAINPWHLHFSRAAFEVNIALFFALFGVWMFVKFEKTKPIYLFISVLSFALSLYSYNVTRLLAPLLLTCLIIVCFDNVKIIPKKTIFALGIFFVFLLLPFLTTLFFPSGLLSSKGALITSSDIQSKIIEFKSYLADLPGIFPVAFFNDTFMLVWQYLENVVSSLSPAFFFVSGTAHGNQGIGVGMFYLFQFPLVILGLISIFKNKIKDLNLFIYWAIISFLVLSLSKEVPHATRGYFIVIPFQVFSAIGALYLLSLIKKFNNAVKIFSGVFFGFIVLFSVLYYFISYYFRFPILYAKAWRLEDKSVSLYIKDNEHKYDKIIFDKNAGFMYTSLLFYLSYTPLGFQNTVIRDPDDSEGFSFVRSFGKYEFRDVDWPNDYKKKRMLFITTADRKPLEIPPLVTFYYPKKPVVFSVKEKVISFPIEEIAYVLVETK